MYKKQNKTADHRKYNFSAQGFTRLSLWQPIAYYNTYFQSSNFQLSTFEY